MICVLFLSLLPASMPDVVTLTAVLQQDGAPLDGAVVARFSLWDAPVGGSATWSDDERAVLVTSGVLVTDIGAQRPLPAAVFTDQLWLEIVVDDQVLSPRVRMGSVPHAIEATHAQQCAAVDGLARSDVEVLKEIASSSRRVLFARPLSCGGGLAMEPLCQTLPCGSHFFDCAGHCASLEPAICGAQDVGWLFGL